MDIRLFIVLIHLPGYSLQGCISHPPKAGNEAIITDSSELTSFPSNTAVIKETRKEDTSNMGSKTRHIETLQGSNALDSIPLIRIANHNITPDSILQYAMTLIGTPYCYASIDPRMGFDCSGFITYVFSHYKIKVPRSSRDFENVGTTVPLLESKKGDLILFTGTDSTERTIGHMGIIISNDKGAVKFIHSSSGKANGVVVTAMGKYYLSRFVKVVRVFK